MIVKIIPASQTHLALINSMVMTASVLLVSREYTVSQIHRGVRVPVHVSTATALMWVIITRALASQVIQVSGVKQILTSVNRRGRVVSVQTV